MDIYQTKESYCTEQKKLAAAAIEQLDHIKNVMEERDDLRKKLERSQEELEHLKKHLAVGKPRGIQTLCRDDAETISCHLPLVEQSTITDKEIKQLEEDIQVMRSENPSPDIETKVIRKEVEVLKKYCSKLSVIQKENFELKTQLAQYESTFTRLGYFDHSKTQVDELKNKISSLTDSMRERDLLKKKVSKLEKQLQGYSCLPEDVEVFKQRSLLLDDIIADRDRLSRRVEQLRGLDQEVLTLRKKASKVTELEDSLMKLTREKTSMEEEFDQLRYKYSAVEIDSYNRQAEGDTLRSKLVCMEHEIETLKCICEDKERLKSERDHLRNNLEELIRMQENFDHMKKHMKCLEVLRAERDMFKSKYENLIGLECECDILRTQVDRAKTVEKDRDALENQVEDLETCIAEQETEIRRLVCHIDLLAKGRDEEQEKFKEILTQMRAEVDKKDSLIFSAEEKLSSVQNELKNSIEGLSNETMKVKNRNENLEVAVEELKLESGQLKSKNDELESCLDAVQTENQQLLQHLIHLKDEYNKLGKQIGELTDDNIFLIQRLEEKESSLNTLRDVLKDHEPILAEFEKCQMLCREPSRDIETETDPIYIMTAESETAKEKNKCLHEKGADQQLQELLAESKSAVNRISMELNKQCEEWYFLQHHLKTIKEERYDQQIDRLKQDNYIVNYCISTGINTNINTWDCIKAKTQKQATQTKTRADCSCSTYEIEVESSSFIFQHKASTSCAETSPKLRSAIGTTTKDLNVASVAMDSRLPPLRKDHVRASLSEENVRKNARTQKPERVIYSTKKRAKSGGTQFEYDICKWNCKHHLLSPVTVTAKGMQDLGSAVSISTDEEASKKLLKTSTCNTARVQYAQSGTQDDKIVCNAVCQSAVETTCTAICAERTVRDVATRKIDDVFAKDEETEAFESARSYPCHHCKDLEEQMEILKKELNRLPPDSVKREMHSLKLEDLESKTCRRCRELERRFNMLENETSYETTQTDRVVCRHCKTLEERVEMCEKELEAANETILKFQEESRKGARALSENEALRRHSAEVQEVAKDQIEDLVDHLRKVQGRATGLEEEIEKLNKYNESILSEKEQLTKLTQQLENQNSELLRRIAELEQHAKDPTELDILRQELEKSKMERDELERHLAKDMIASTRRNTLQESDIASLNLRNKELETEMARLQCYQGENKNLNNKLALSETLSKSLEDKLTSCFKENKSLLDELNKAKLELKRMHDAQLDTTEVEKLRMENQNLLRQVNQQTSEVRQLMDKIKSPPVEAMVRTQEETKEKEVLKTICSDIETQLKCIERAPLVPCRATKGLQQTIDELTKRLEDSERRSKKAEALLSDMKLSDPTAMLNGELTKCKARLTALEVENESLSSSMRQGDKNADNLMAELQSERTKLSKCSEERDQLKKDIALLKEKNAKLSGALADMSGDSLLKDEINKLQRRIEKLESDKAELENKLTERERGYEKIDKMQLDIGELKRDQLKAENEAEKLRKELEAALNNNRSDAARIEQLENGKTKNLTTIQNLEKEIARLKKELENVLSDAKDSSTGAADLQNEIAKFKLKIDRLEGDNSKLRKDLENALAALQDTNEKLTQKALERDNLLKEKQSNDEKFSKLKAQLDKALADAAADTSSKEIDILKNKLAKIEAENATLHETDNLQDVIVKLRQQMASLEGENAKLHKDLDKAKADVRDAKQQYDAPISSTLDQLGKLESENARLNRELNELLDKFGAATAENLQHREEMKMFKQKAALLESENARQKKEMNDILDGSKISTGELAKLKDSESALRRRLAQLETENLNLKKDLDAISDANKNYLSQMQELRNNVGRLERENESVKQSLDLAIRDVSPTDETAVWKQKALQTEEALKKLKMESEIAADEHKKCPKIIAQLKEENDRLNKKLAGLEKENGDLKGKFDGAMGDFKNNESEMKALKSDSNKSKQIISQLEGENGKLNQNVLLLTAQLQDVNATLSKMKEETIGLKQKTAMLESAGVKLKNDLDAALGDNDNLQKIVNQMKNENSKLMEKIARLEVENAKLKKEFENVTGQQKIAPTSDSRLKDKLAQLENENKKLKSELNNVLDEAKQSAEAKDHAMQLKHQLATLENEASRFKSELEKALNDAQTGSNLVTQLKDENAKLKQKLGQLEGEVASLKEDLNRALEQAKLGASGVSKAQDSDAKLKQRMAQLEKDNEALKRDLAKAVDDAKSGSTATADLRDENAKQKQLAAQLQAEIEKLKKKLDTSATKKPSIDSDIAEYKKKLNQLQKENDNLKLSLQGAYGDAKSTADANTKLIDENASLKKKMQALQSEMDALKNDFKAGEIEKKRLANDIVKMKENEGKLRKQLTQLESLKQSVDVSDDKTSKKVIDENAALKEALDRTENELKQIKNSLDDALNEAKKKANEVEKLKDEKVSLKQKLVELEKNNANLKAELDATAKEISRLKKEQGVNVSSLREQFDGDLKDILKKNEDDIANLHKAHRQTIDELNNEHERELKALQNALQKLKKECAETTDERDKFKQLLDEQRRKSLDIKDKVEQVEDVINRERRRSKEEKQKSKSLAEKLDEQRRKSKDLESQLSIFCRKSEELEDANQEVVKKLLKLEKEKDHLETSSTILRESFERELSKSEDLQKDLGVLRKMLTDKKEKQLQAETFKTVSLDGKMPEVIAITAPLSDKELKFFGKKTCICKPNLQGITNKLAMEGLFSLTIEELQFLHYKLCDATADQLAKMGQTSGILKPNEGDRLGLLKRIAALEGDLLKKQKHAQQKVIAMQYAVKLEKERLQDLKKSLEDEKKKNSDLLSQLDSHSKTVTNIREERDSIQRQKSYHEQKLEQYIVTIEEERARTRNLEDELDKEKTNVLHLKSLLEAERDRAKLNKRKDTEALERMRIKLEKTVNSETVLKMKLQDKLKRSQSPCTPVKDTNHPVSTKTRVCFYSPSSSETKPFKSYSGRKLSSGCSQVSSSRLDYSEK